MNIPTLYHEWILWIGETTGLSDPLLHIHAGMAILIAARLAIHRSLGTFIPFWFVLAAELGNEVMDWLSSGLMWEDTLSDLFHTLLWPFLLSLGIRIRPMIPSGLKPGVNFDRYSSPDLGIATDREVHRANAFQN